MAGFPVTRNQGWASSWNTAEMMPTPERAIHGVRFVRDVVVAGAGS